jgi:cytochrome P450
MVQNVDVQRKAQAEIDRVVPDWRLPNADDYESLPYTAAVVQETLRRHPVTPLSAHQCARVWIHILIIADRYGSTITRG